MRGGEDGKLYMFMVIFGSMLCCIVRYVKIQVAAFLALGTRHISLGISAIL